MQTQKYAIQQSLIESLLTWVKEAEISLPETQLPANGGESKVLDLMGVPLYPMCSRSADHPFLTHSTTSAG